MPHRQIYSYSIINTFDFQSFNLYITWSNYSYVLVVYFSILVCRTNSLFWSKNYVFLFLMLVYMDKINFIYLVYISIKMKLILLTFLYRIFCSIFGFFFVTFGIMNIQEIYMNYISRN